MSNDPQSGTPEFSPDGLFAGEMPELANQGQRGGSSDDVEQLRQELAEAEKKALRYQADLDNFRRRTRREAEDLARYAVLPMVNEILDALDNLRRAIDAGQSGGDTVGLASGVQMVADQISRTLANHGCQPIVSLGQPFDPAQHQAVQMAPSDEYPANHVAAEFRPGFRLHDRVVRPAQVVVSTGPAT